MIYNVLFKIILYIYIYIMTGGLLQLKYNGSDNNIFIGNPQISFFKNVFKTYSNFATEYINVNFIKTPEFNTFTQANIPIYGDLINKMYLDIDLKITPKKTNNYFELKHNEFTNNSINQPLYTNNTRFLDESTSKGIKYKYNSILGKKVYYLHNYKYKFPSVFTNLVIYESTLHTNNINVNTVKNLVSNNNECDLSNVTSKTLHISFTYNSINSYDIVYIDEINIDFNRFIKKITFEIDEYIIENHNTEWLLTYDQYFCKNESSYKITKLLKNVNCAMIRSNFPIKLHIPLRFFFTKDNTYALPIGNLFNSDVNIKLYTNSQEYVFDSINPIIDSVEFTKVNLLINYIFLDEADKLTFLQKYNTMLIEQVQQQSNIISTLNSPFDYELDFVYLCKYLIWNIPEQYHLESGKILFNNNDLFNVLDGEYFHLIQPLEYNLGNTEFTKMEFNINKNGTYYLYSFSLFPNNKQPSGLCNMSRIDKKVLQLTIKHNNSESTEKPIIPLHIFSVNYNILVMNGGKCTLQF